MRPERPLGVTAAQVYREPDCSLLAPNEVHAWVASLEPPPDAAALHIAVTSDAERDRASRFRKPVDAERFLVAHGALRLLLAKYLTCDPRALCFGATDNGKPFLENAGLEFNLSHSGALALIAVAHHRQVGVDIEQIRPMADLDDLAKRVCTPVEAAMLASLAESHRERAFFAMWTRKEALAKATGEGIGGVFGDASSPATRESERWTGIEIDDLPGYAACVVAEGSDWQLVRRSMNDFSDPR